LEGSALGFKKIASECFLFEDYPLLALAGPLSESRSKQAGCVGDWQPTKELLNAKVNFG
jgi:hypothetical protein